MVPKNNASASQISELSPQSQHQCIYHHLCLTWSNFISVALLLPKWNLARLMEGKMVNTLVLVLRRYLRCLRLRMNFAMGSTLLLSIDTQIIAYQMLYCWKKTVMLCQKLMQYTTKRIHHRVHYEIPYQMVFISIYQYDFSTSSLDSHVIDFSHDPLVSSAAQLQKNIIDK